MSSPRSPSSSQRESRPEILFLSSPQPTVTITAKPAFGHEQTFVVHKAFLCYYSKFFADAFEGKSREELRGTMVLEHTDPEAFGLLIDWLYFQTIEHKKTDIFDFCDYILTLYSMARRYSIPKLRNDIIVHTLSHNRRHNQSSVD